MHPDSSIDTRRARFCSTQWSVVLAAGQKSSPDSAAALAALCQTYWYPLYAYARRRGKNAPAAEDATQAFFAEVLDKQYLRSADPQRGRFRSYLLTMFKRFLSSQRRYQAAAKRGGTLNKLSLDFSDGETRYLAEPADRWTAERLYERRWALTLLGRVLDQLRDLYVAKGKDALFEHAQVFLTSDAADHRYQEVAGRLKLSSGALRVAVHRMRAQYRELLIAEVGQTLEDPTESEDELNHLRRAIRGED